MDTNGKCRGACTGMCFGTCDAQCTGKCDGACSGTCAASCSGGCRGTCSAEVSPPRCEEVQHEVVVDDCKTTCESKARFEASCTEASASVTFGGSASTIHRANIERLVVAVKNNYVRLLRVVARTGNAIGTAAAGYYVALQGATTYAEQVGLQAGACVGDALISSAGAISQIEVAASFSVSISVSASASGSATAM
jgi:hypothetical protein